MTIIQAYKWAVTNQALAYFWVAFHPGKNENRKPGFDHLLRSYLDEDIKEQKDFAWRWNRRL